MVTAYILIEMVAGHSRDLVSALTQAASVREVSRVTGPFDVIAVIQSEDLNAISEKVTAEIHSQEGVVRTTTCVSME